MKRILVVEDEGIVALDLYERLKRNGDLVVGTAKSAEEALDLVVQENVDFALMDIMIDGDLSGIDLAKILYEFFDIPVVFLSALNNDHVKTMAIESHAYGFIQKPFSSKELYTIIDYAAKKHEHDRMKPNPYLAQYNRMLKETKVLLAPFFEKNIETAEHSFRVMKVCKIMAAHLFLPELKSMQLDAAALLHDIGKGLIPEQILLKEQALDEVEWAIMQEHTLKGAHILSETHELMSLAQIVECHHEWWNGEGYPRGLKGEEIPILSRIIAIGDAWDVMTHSRVYSPVKSHEEAKRELIKNKGKQFDPALVELFLDIYPEIYKTQ